jgi:ricin-type beta-trefoil lectin protein
LTVSATDVYGTTGCQHFVLDVSAGVTYTTSVSARGAISNKLSGKCMDAADGDFAPGGLIQQWTCGAAVKGVNGADQRFQYVTIKGSDGSAKGYLEAISPSGQVFYVTPTSGAKNAQLALTTSRTTADDMAKVGPYYTFPNTGLVADDAGQSKLNGAKVIGYQQDNGTNQQWSLP